MINRQLHVVVAPDSFKYSLSSHEAAAAIERGIRDVLPDAIVDKIPLSDGGEGLAKNVTESLGGKYRSIEVTGPDFEPVVATYGFIDKHTAVMEMAEASGITLSKWHDPSRTTTYGTGEMIRDAIKQGAKKIILGIGGSATNDAGIGMAAALGVRFLDSSGIGVELTGAGLSNIESIDTAFLDTRLKDIEILVACDVTNPLYGEKGAAYVYAAQKGANRDMILRLDKGLRNVHRVLKKSLGLDYAKVKGAGAAGGLGAGLLAFTQSTLKPGIEVIFELFDFDRKIAKADLVITGEGSIDDQTLDGKVISGVGRYAKRREIPTIALCGSYKGDLRKLNQEGITSVFSINHELIEEQQAFAETAENLTQTTRQIIRVMNVLGVTQGE